MHENSIMTYGFMDHSLAITHLLWMVSHSEVSKVNFQLRCSLVSAVFLKYRLLRRLVSLFLLEILAFCSKSYHFNFFSNFRGFFCLYCCVLKYNKFCHFFPRQNCFTSTPARSVQSFYVFRIQTNKQTPRQERYIIYR